VTADGKTWARRKLEAFATPCLYDFALNDFAIPSRPHSFESASLPDKGTRLEAKSWRAKS
jgi:hypothetical protein